MSDLDDLRRANRERDDAANRERDAAADLARKILYPEAYEREQRARRERLDQLRADLEALESSD